MADDTPDVDAWLKKRQQQPTPGPNPEQTEGANVESWLNKRGKAPPPSPTVSPTEAAKRGQDPVGYYGRGFVRGLGRSVVSAGEGFFSLADAANQMLPHPAPGGGFVSPELRQKGREFVKSPYTMPGEQAGYWTGNVLPLVTGLGGLARSAAAGPGIARTAVEVGGWEGAWTVADHLLGTSLHGLGLPSYAARYMLTKLIYGRGKKMIEALAGKKAEEVLEKAGVKAGEELKVAKGAGNFIPKAAESKGAARVKTQSKFTPKEAEAPTAAETKASSHQTARNILKRTSKSGAPSSGDIAAAKLAKMTGAIHPGEEEVVEEFARMPVKR